MHLGLITGSLSMGFSNLASPCAQAYEQQQQGAARPDSNYARYGPSYYNGAGSSGATAFPTGYPNRP